jgi:hypothetical protein
LGRFLLIFFSGELSKTKIMSTPSSRQGDALYIIIVRDSQANTLLKNWANKNRQEVHLANNKMSLYTQNSLSLFQVTWNNDWGNVTIWDTWNRRHIYLS